MIKKLWPATVLFGFVSFFFLAGAISAASQSATPAGVMLPTVNGAPFTAGPVTVDSTHCGWNYVLSGGAFYRTVVPDASGFPVGCRIAVTNADPLPTGSNTAVNATPVGLSTPTCLPLRSQVKEVIPVTS